MGRVFSDICLFVVFFSRDISKTDAVLITKLETEMFNDESRKKTFILQSKCQMRGHNKCASVFRQNAILILAACVSHAGFSLLQYLTGQDMLASNRDKIAGRRLLLDEISRPADFQGA